MSGRRKLCAVMFADGLEAVVFDFGVVDWRLAPLPFHVPVCVCRPMAPRNSSVVLNTEGMFLRTVPASSRDTGADCRPERTFASCAAAISWSEATRVRAALEGRFEDWPMNRVF